MKLDQPTKSNVAKSVCWDYFSTLPGRSAAVGIFVTKQVHVTILAKDKIPVKCCRSLSLRNINLFMGSI
jgi:hypothetical protein